MNPKHFAVALCFVLSAAPGALAQTTSDAKLTEPLDRRTVLREALERNPAAHVFEQQAEASRAMAKAEGALPPPEVTGEVWQVPFSQPLAFNSNMIMIGVTQSFPAPGVLAAREQAAAAQAAVDLTMASDRARLIVRDAGHAFADYAESTAKHRIHRAHLDVMQRLLDVARARHATGGSLTDVVRAEVEVSRVEADFVTDATLIESARAQLNALLGRDPVAPLGPPQDSEPMVPSEEVAVLVARAHAARPEFKRAEAAKEAREFAAQAADREATWPSFTVGALYFPPTQAMPEHGYGARLSMSLPWLWGAARRRNAADQKFLEAAHSDLEATKFPVNAEVVTAESKGRSAAYRFQVLRDRTLPASRRAFDVAQAGFESGRTDLMTVLDARRAVVDVEQEMVMARSALEHALTDLEAAVGSDVPTRPLGPLGANPLGESHAH